MNNKTKKVASVAFTGAAAATMAGVYAGPALAAGGTWSVKNGTTPYTGAYSGTATATGTKLVDTTHAVSLNCKSAFASGSIPAATGPTSKPVGTVAAASFFHCSVLGVAFKAHLNHATSLFVSGSTKSGVTPGYIGNKTSTTKAISATISGSGNTCHATITGTNVPATYHNASHELIVNAGHAATLTIHSPTAACPIIKNGDAAYFTANYKVNTPTALNITDP